MNGEAGSGGAGMSGVRWLRIALWLGLISLAIWFLTKIAITIIIFIIAMLITYLLSPIMYGLEGRWEFFKKRPLPCLLYTSPSPRD